MTQLRNIVVTTDGVQQQFNGSWYRGETTNFIPSKAMLDTPGALVKYILHGWSPEAPFLNKTTRITAFGSCFAQNITRWLHDRGYAVNGNDLKLDAHIVRFGEGIVNTFAIREQIEWALEGKSLDEGLWFGANKEIVLPTEEARVATRDLLLGSETIIITVGLSEIWHDKQSGRAFWRAIPSEMFDETRHGFRLSTVEENFENLRALREVLLRHNPNCKLIVTLSPIPLMATFRPIGCLSANSVSKAVLRVAIDQLMSLGLEETYYFPSYEIVKDFFVDPYIEDNRHVRPEIVDFIMQAFAHQYCEDEGS